MGYSARQVNVPARREDEGPVNGNPVLGNPQPESISDVGRRGEAGVELQVRGEGCSATGAPVNDDRPADEIPLLERRMDEPVEGEPVAQVQNPGPVAVRGGNASTRDGHCQHLLQCCCCALIGTGFFVWLVWPDFCKMEGIPSTLTVLPDTDVLPFANATSNSACFSTGSGQLSIFLAVTARNLSSFVSDRLVEAADLLLQLKFCEQLWAIPTNGSLITTACNYLAVKYKTEKEGAISILRAASVYLPSGFAGEVEIIPSAIDPKPERAAPPVMDGGGLRSPIPIRNFAHPVTLFATPSEIRFGSVDLADVAIPNVHEGSLFEDAAHAVTESISAAVRSSLQWWRGGTPSEEKTGQMKSKDEITIV